MATWNPQANELFLKALELSQPAREEYLNGACAGDDALRADVEALLEANAGAGSFLDKHAGAVGVTGDFAFVPGNETADSPPRECEGTVVGPYKLLQQIGEGGMGTVYMAEQTQPIKRKVALKIIKAGMDTRLVIARFEAERQALAVMDHPNIAKVFDAGTTENGLPYFVMELVKGVPITRYCDEHRLTPRQRLELFLPVCQAIQHAHQKGIIHRDIKPSNVLVAPFDGKPVVKVIDFGVAKATGQQLTDKTLFTGFGAVVGTLEYMSPEQAELNNQDIDTRSDIYSLGVLLYELLTGSTPLNRKRFKQAAFDEVLRIIREEEPQRPSTRLSTTEELPTVAANRGSEPRRLSAIVRGELDWIVMKALEKDRNRRYETSNGFAADVQRYLNGDPVQAHPASVAYRLRKFLQRNQRTMVPAGLILLALVAGMVGTTLGMLRARDAAESQKLATLNAEEREAETAAILTFLDGKILGAARPEGLDGGLGVNVTLRQAIESAVPFVEENFKDRPLIEARLRATLGISFHRLDDAKSAAEQLERSLALYTEHRGAEHRDTLRGMQYLANAYSALARTADALKLREESLALCEKQFGPDDPDTLAAMNNLANSYATLARYDEAIALREKTVARRRATLGPDHADTLSAMGNLANSYASVGRHAEALELREQSLARLRAKLGPDHPQTLTAMRGLATSYSDLLRHHDALKLREELVGLIRARYGPDHTETLQTMKHLANSYSALGRHPEALKIDEDIVALQKVKNGLGHPETLSSMKNLAICYDAVKRYDDAVKLRAETLAGRKAALGADHPDTIASMNDLALSYTMLDRHPEALKLFEEALALEERRAAAEPANVEILVSTAGMRCNMARSHNALNDYAKAVACCDKAIALLEVVLKKVPQHSWATRFLRNAHSVRAKAGERLGRYADADKDWERAIALSLAHQKAEVTADRDAWRGERGKPPATGATADRRMTLLRRHNAKGADLYIRNQLAGAKNEYEQGVDLGQKLVADFPTDAEAELALATSLHGLGLVLAQVGQLPEAERFYQQALEIQQKQAAMLPARQDVLRELAGCHRSLGNLQAANRQLTEAERSLRQSVTLLEKLVTDSPRSRDFREDLAMSRNNLTFVLNEGDRVAEALTIQSQAVDAQIELAGEFPDVPQYQRTLGASYMNLAVMLKANGQIDKAETAYGKAIEVLEKLASRHVTIPEYRQVLAICHHNRGNLLRETGRLPDAEKAYGRALPILNDLVKAFPRVPQFRENLSNTCVVLGILMDQTGRHAEALKAFRDALAATPANPRVQDKLSWFLSTCPHVELRQATEAVALATKAVEQAKQNGGFWLTLGVAQYRAGEWKASIDALNQSAQLLKGDESVVGFFLAMARWQRGEQEEARKHYDRAVIWMEKNRPKDPSLLRFRAEAAALLKTMDQP